jgi:hypothetical protein
MPTVKELISEYGEGLVGQFVRTGRGTHEVTKVEGYNIETIGPKGTPNDTWVHYELSEAEIVDTPNHTSQSTKTPFHLLDLGFAAAMCRNWEAGIKEGRTANDWETLPRTNETRERYAAKIMRHLHEYVEQRGVAAEHLAAIACNANILWHIEGRGE